MIYIKWHVKIALSLLSFVIIFSICGDENGASSGITNIDGGPTDSSSPTGQNVAAQIVNNNFIGKPELMFTSWKTPNDTAIRSMWMPSASTTISRTQHNKNLIPPASVSIFQQTGGSFLRTRVHLNHPAGSTLFADNAILAQLLDTFLKSCQNADNDQAATGHNFLIYFSQFHLNILHELYMYLTGIYTTINLSHYGQYSAAYMKYLEEYRKEPDPASGIPTWKIPPLQDYLTKENIYALNKKALIINHLINVIEAQSNKAILARFPALPQHLATRAGMMMMKYDYGAKLELLIDGQEIAFIEAIAPNLNQNEKQSAGNVISSMRANYLQGFSSYFNLFKQYTSLLEQGSQGIEKFIAYATTIENEISKATPLLTQYADVKNQISELRKIETINPPIFFYNDEAMRGIRLIPILAQTLPPNSQKIPLPQKIIDEAQAGTKLPFANQPVAFYADDEHGVSQLYINIPTAQGMFAQKLLPQPDWLSTSSGAIKMLRACLGDFSVLLDDVFKEEHILDPCLTCIVAHAANISSKAPSACNDCTTYLTTIRNFIAQAQTQAQNGGLPDIETGQGSTSPKDTANTAGAG